MDTNIRERIDRSQDRINKINLNDILELPENADVSWVIFGEGPTDNECKSMRVSQKQLNQWSLEIVNNKVPSGYSDIHSFILDIRKRLNESPEIDPEKLEKIRRQQ